MFLNTTRADKSAKEFEDSMRVPVKMEYELGEQTEHRFKDMGTRCVRETLDVEYYYDTDSFQLASTQTWLNQHNGQWGLILAEEQLNHAQSYNTKMLEAGYSEEKKSKILNSSHEEKWETGAVFGETSSNECPEKVMSKSQVQRTSSDTSLTYTELSDPCFISQSVSSSLWPTLKWKVWLWRTSWTWPGFRCMTAGPGPAQWSTLCLVASHWRWRETTEFPLKLLLHFWWWMLMYWALAVSWKRWIACVKN